MEVTCTICFNNMKSSDELYGTTCGHVCHDTCMIDWLRRSRTCPQCRQVVHDGEIRRIYLNFTNTENSLMENVLNNHQSELKNLQSLLHQRDLQMQKDAAIITKYQSRLEALQIIVGDRDRQRAVITAEHQSLLKDLTNLQQKQHQQQQQTAAIIANYQGELKDLRRIVQQKNQQIEQRDQQMQQNAAIIANLQDEIKNKDAKNIDQMTLIENLSKQIEDSQRYFQGQLAMQRERISELESWNKLSSEQLVAEMKRVTSVTEKCIKLEECVADFSKKLSAECAINSNVVQLLRMCTRQKLELQARLDSLGKRQESKENKNVETQNNLAKPKVEPNASESKTKKRAATVNSTVKSECNPVQPKVQPNASVSNTKKRATRAPLGTINQNSEQSRYNLRPR